MDDSTIGDSVDWIVVDPDRPIRPLTTAQGDRAGGVLLGMGVVDGWSRATELALCVADAAATGRALSDPLVLDLLRRNVGELRSTHAAAVDLSDPNAMLATTAVVALAHLHDNAAERADAARAVAATMDPSTAVDGTVLKWVELVAETVRTGVLSRVAAGPGTAAGTASGTTSAVVDAVIASVADAELADGTGAGAFDAASAVAPAARGALLGARFGWRAVPDELASRAAGWPGTDARALVGLGIHAARLRRRSVEAPRDPADVSGDDVPVEQWSASSELSGPGTPPATPEPRGDAPRWRRSWVALTPGDAQSNGAPESGQ